MRAAGMRNATVIAVAVGLWLVAFTQPALGDLRFENEFTYTVDADNSSLTVDIDMHLVNTTPDSVEGGVVTQTFFTGFELFVPLDATEFDVSGDGGSLEYTREPSEDDGFDLVTVELGRRLFFREAMDVQVNWRINGDEPRSDSQFRVNPAYFAVPVFGFGTPRHVDVNLVVPLGYELTFEGDVLTTSATESGQLTYSALDIEDPDEFFAWVSGVDNSKLSTERVVVEEVEIVVRSWPGDDFWTSEVIAAAQSGLPVLLDLIGLEYAQSAPLVVTESAEVTASGYGGWYIKDRNLVEIGEYVDADLVLHELSHIWLNQDLFDRRWIIEGLAEVFAAESAVAAGLAEEVEVRQVAFPSSHPEIPSLNEWDYVTVESFDSIDDLFDYEQAGYSLSEWVLQQVVDEIGFESMRDVVYAVSNDEIAYRGEPEPESVARATAAWYHFLDLLQEVGGSEDADELFFDHVTEFEYEERDAARRLYEEVRASTNGWELPLLIREPMSRWQFEYATRWLGQVGPIVEARDEVESDLLELGLELRPKMEDLFELATGSFDEVVVFGAELAEATDQVLEAKGLVDADRSLFEEVGLIGSEIEAEFDDTVRALDSEDFDAAEAEAAEVVAIADAAETQGLIRMGALLAVLALFGLGGWLLVRRRRLKRAGLVDK